MSPLMTFTGRYRRRAVGSQSRIVSIGFALLLAGFVVASAVPAVALQTSVGITVTVNPEAPYWLTPADYTILVEVAEGAVSDVTVQIEHDCTAVSGPTEVTGDGDDILEPGEQWQYTCHSDFVVHGVVLVTVTGTDEVGSPVAESAMLDYGAPFPFDIGITASASEVDEGDELTWEVLVGNLGPYAIINVDGRARLNRSGAYSPMTGPVVMMGNGDDLLDPGEVWAYQYTTIIHENSFLSVAISGAPQHQPGGGIVSTVDSDVVTFIPSPPAPTPASPAPNVLPFTGVDVATVALIGLLSFFTGLSSRRFVTKEKLNPERVAARDDP